MYPKQDNPDKLIRLTYGKIGWTSKGFVLGEGKATFPTDFEVFQKDMEGDYFVLKGKLRDNDDATKAIALEDADSGHNTL